MRSWLTAVLLGVCGLTLAGSPGSDNAWAVIVFPSGTEFSVELAADPESQVLGYMFREKIGPREGMLFLFETSTRHSMWMKNCRVSLDMIWLDDDYRVVEIAADQPPCPREGPCSSIIPMRASRYVLEVAAGVAAREALEPGDRLILLGGPEGP